MRDLCQKKWAHHIQHRLSEAPLRQMSLKISDIFDNELVLSGSRQGMLTEEEGICTIDPLW
jgi:hypothetical protein